MSAVIKYRCLTCKSTRGTPADNGMEDWFRIEMEHGSISPFCSPRCREVYASLPLWLQLTGITGDLALTCRLLAATEKGTMPRDDQSTTRHFPQFVADNDDPKLSRLAGWVHRRRVGVAR